MNLLRRRTVCSIVGARPQFIKAGPLSRALRRRFREILVHTGQHYDVGMSQVFFDELDLPRPDISLGIRSGNHGDQTGRMLIAIERVLLRVRPDLVLVYGDTNSTLAGALASAKLGIPVAHVEAGMRSFNRGMPEELNRVVADHVSTLLFCSTPQAARWLHAEGISDGVYVVGDIMLDTLRENARRATTRSTVLQRFGLSRRGYALATVHRAENTDNPKRLRSIIEGLRRLNEPVVLPLHPRTRDRLRRFALLSLLGDSRNIRTIQPVGYLDMIELERNAKTILTDSGGIQKEAYFLRVPCVTLRAETEWVETVQSGWNLIAGTSTERIVRAAARSRRPRRRRAVFGTGRAAERIAAHVNRFLR